MLAAHRCGGRTSFVSLRPRLGRVHRRQAGPARHRPRAAHPRDPLGRLAGRRSGADGDRRTRGRPRRRDRRARGDRPARGPPPAPRSGHPRRLRRRDRRAPGRDPRAAGPRGRRPGAGASCATVASARTPSAPCTAPSASSSRARCAISCSTRGWFAASEQRECRAGVGRAPRVPSGAPAPLHARGSAAPGAGRLGCGDAGAGTPAQDPPPTVGAQDFPRPGGVETLDDLEGDLPQGPILQLRSPCSRRASTASPSRSTTLRAPSCPARTSRSTPLARTAAPSAAPFPARSESLAVKGAFRPSRTTTDDPGLPAKSVYVAEVPFKRDPVRSSVIALVRLDDRLIAHRPPRRCGSGRRVPRRRRWASARSRSTPTPLASAGGRPARASTPACRPPPSCTARTSATSLGKKPAVLVFATPQLCQSRVCGPVVDVAAAGQGRSGRRPSPSSTRRSTRTTRWRRACAPQLGAWRLCY